MQTYLTALQQILNHGILKSDRTSTGTISLFGMQQRYNLAEGFPAVTTKKLAWKAVVSELLWFLEGSGDERRLAEILHGTRAHSREKEEITPSGEKLKSVQQLNTIWTANANAPYWIQHAQYDGDLQKVYGYQWRKWGSNYHNWANEVVLIEQSKASGVNQPFALEIPLESPKLDVTDSLVGTTILTTNCGDVKVLQKISKTRYKVQFLSGINAVIECSGTQLVSGDIQNPYAMNEADGNGCYGIISKTSRYTKAAYKLWLTMMKKCHGTEVFVDSEWRCFSNFYRDIHGLIGFDHWVKEPSKFVLDHEYYGNDFFGRNSTIFLPSQYANILTTDGSLYVATHKRTGEVYKFTSPSLFKARTKSKMTATKSWHFTKESPPDGFKWRQRFAVDQLLDLVEGIKRDPNGRRHIITAWNPGELSSMALPPCHCFAQFYVVNGKLSCQLYQRSNDFFLGCPFNIASYALLTHMIAQVCDLEVGDFVHVTGDAHLYVPHIDSAKEQLTRTPFAMPKLQLNPAVKDITKFTMDDIKLIDYQCHSPIKAAMAV